MSAEPPSRRSKHARAHTREQRMAALVDSVRDYAIFMLDPRGRVVSWNPGAERIKGYRASEIIGRHFSVFYPDEARAAGRPEELLALAATEGRVHDEGWRLRKDGSRFWADVVITPLRELGGELYGFAKVTRDLSERRAADAALRRSEERFRLLVAAIKDHAIFLLDTDGRVATWNAGAEAITGYAAGEILGQPFTCFLGEAEQSSGAGAIQLALAARDGRVEEEGWRVRKDGTRFWAHVTMSALRDAAGEHLGFAQVTRDMTREQLLHAERLKAAQAEEALRLRDEFLSLASHELRTPLTALQLQLQSLNDQAACLDDSKLVAGLARAARSGDRLAELVESLFDVSRLVTGAIALSCTRFDLAEAVEQVVERLAAASVRARSPILVETGGPLVGEWDRLRIEQLLIQLIANALEFGAGKPIRVALSREDGHALLSVSDGGPGIPETELERIFERFGRAASMRHHGGLGVGLWMAREIARAHHGSVAVENVPGGGARFMVRLPLALHQVAEDEHEAHAQRSAAALRRPD